MDIRKQLLYIAVFAFIAMSLIYPRLSYADPLQNWTNVTSNTNDWFYGMTYGTVSGSNMFVTVGDNGKILTSPDGVAWTHRTSGDTHHLYGVGYGNSTFVAVGTVGTIITSTNGTTWNLQTSGVSDYLYGAAYGNSLHVVVGASGTILTSADNGTTWVDPFFASIPPADNWLFGITYGGTQFATVGEYDGTPAHSVLLTSPDGSTWTSQTSWTPPNPPNPITTDDLFGIAYGNGTFVAVGDDGVIITSTDGVTWSTAREGAIGNEALNGVAFGTVNSIDYFVAVGAEGTILTSPASDLVTWSYRPSGTTYDLEAVAYDSTNQAFAAVGGFGTILLDGDTIPVSPVRVWDPHDIYFESLQQGYDNIGSAILMESQALHFNEDVYFDLTHDFTFRGGYDGEYSANPSYTTINGSLTVTDGTVVLDKLIIQ